MLAVVISLLRKLKFSGLYSIFPKRWRKSIYLKISLVYFISLAFAVRIHGFVKLLKRSFALTTCCLHALVWVFVIDKKKINSLLTYTGCFSCTMEGGFRIYNVEPLSEKARVGESLIITMIIINKYYLKHKHSNQMIILKDWVINPIAKDGREINSGGKTSKSF